MRVASIVFGIVLLLWSGATAVVDVLFAAPYRDIARQLETGRATAPDPAYHANVETSLGGAAVFSLCERDIVRSSVSIALASVETAYRQKVPTTELEAALGRARSTLIRAIRCRPRDGNFWLRLAVIDHAASGKVTNVEAPLLASFTLSPSEAWIAMARVAFGIELGARAGPQVAKSVEADVHNLMRYARAAQAAKFYITSDQAVRQALDAELASLSEDRRKVLRQEIEWAAPQAPDK